MNKIKQYIIKRLTEASTLRGIILFLGSLVGYTFSPDQINSIVWIVLGISGFFGLALPDKIGTEKEKVSKIFSIENTIKTDPKEEYPGWNDK